MSKVRWVGEMSECTHICATLRYIYTPPTQKRRYLLLKSSSGDFFFHNNPHRTFKSRIFPEVNQFIIPLIWVKLHQPKPQQAKIDSEKGSRRTVAVPSLGLQLVRSSSCPQYPIERTWIYPTRYSFSSFKGVTNKGLLTSSQEEPANGKKSALLMKRIAEKTYTESSACFPP